MLVTVLINQAKDNRALSMEFPVSTSFYSTTPIVCLLSIAIHTKRQEFLCFLSWQYQPSLFITFPDFLANRQTKNEEKKERQKKAVVYLCVFGCI